MTFFNFMVALCGAVVGTIVVLIPAIALIAHTASTVGAIR